MLRSEWKKQLLQGQKMMKSGKGKGREKVTEMWQTRVGDRSGQQPYRRSVHGLLFCASVSGASEQRRPGMPDGSSRS